MEKTIRYFLLVMVITGVLFSYGCIFTDDLYDADNIIVAEEAEEGDEDNSEEENKDESDEEAEESEEAEETTEENSETDAGAGMPEDAPVNTEATEEATPAEEVQEDAAAEEPVVETATETDEDTPVEEVAEPATEDTAPAEPTTMYQNGNFSSQGNYFSPAGSESIEVSFTIDNDVVTAVTVTPSATDSTSAQYQAFVRDAAAGLVVGKNLSEIGGFDKISTSSLTTNGFNSAVEAIKSQAQV